MLMETRAQVENRLGNLGNPDFLWKLENEGGNEERWE